MGNHLVWFAAAEVVGMFAVMRGAGWSVILVGQGTPNVDVHAAARQMLTIPERDAARAMFNVPPVGVDPEAATSWWANGLWDHQRVPPQFRYEEAMRGSHPPAAVG